MMLRRRRTFSIVSGKLKLLDRMLRHFFKDGHKGLSSHNSQRCLTLSKILILRGCDQCCRIDGGVKLDDRQSQIEAFNEEGSNKNIFLLSTRAGVVST